MQLSAFVDGELPSNEAELLLRRLSQDAELRQQVAEFMAIGRAMRGEVQVKGIDSLRGCVADEIDVELPMAVPVEEVAVPNRLVRPLVGFAIAASVALVAIFGLRQAVDGDAGNAGDASQMANGEEPAAYTQQQPGDILEDELLREMRRMHDIASSDQSINTRLTALEIRQQLADEEADEQADKTSTDDEDAVAGQ